MKRSVKRRHRNYLIMGLCSILLIMGVGYAAFSSKLDISGTSSITSIWDVEITNVVEKEKVGNANTVGLPTWDKTNASIKATFEAPGDSVTYDITVSNLGTLNAVLDSIKINMNDQDIIFFRVTGITSGEVLNAHDDITFQLEMTYNENITTQTGETNIDFNMDMNYLQDGNSSNFSDADTDTSNTLSINNINITPTENSAKVEVSASNAIKYYYSIDNNKWYETVEDIYNLYDLKPNIFRFIAMQ